jgi:hypothetical protein
MKYELTKAGKANAAARSAQKQGWTDVAQIYRDASAAYEAGKYTKGDRLMEKAFDDETPLVDAALGRREPV